VIKGDTQDKKKMCGSLSWQRKFASPLREGGEGTQSLGIPGEEKTLGMGWKNEFFCLTITTKLTRKAGKRAIRKGPLERKDRWSESAKGGRPNSRKPLQANLRVLFGQWEKTERNQQRCWRSGQGCGGKDGESFRGRGGQALSGWRGRRR